MQKIAVFNIDKFKTTAKALACKIVGRAGFVEESSDMWTDSKTNFATNKALAIWLV